MAAPAKQGRGNRSRGMSGGGGGRREQRRRHSVYARGEGVRPGAQGKGCDGGRRRKRRPRDGRRREDHAGPEKKSYTVGFSVNCISYLPFRLEIRKLAKLAINFQTVASSLTPATTSSLPWNVSAWRRRRG